MPSGPPWIHCISSLMKCTCCWRSPLHLADKAQPGANYVVWRYSSILLKHSSYSRGLEASMLLLYKLRLLPLMPAWTWHYCNVQLASCPASLFSQISLLMLRARFCASVSLINEILRVKLVYLAAKFCALTPMLRRRSCADAKLIKKVWPPCNWLTKCGPPKLVNRV